jgi:hypothetical protein
MNVTEKAEVSIARRVEIACVSETEIFVNKQDLALANAEPTAGLLGRLVYIICKKGILVPEELDFVVGDNS